MIITYRQLKALRPCEEGLAYWEKHFGQGDVTLTPELIRQHANCGFIEWLAWGCLWATVGGPMTLPWPSLGGSTALPRPRLGGSITLPRPRRIGSTALPGLRRSLQRWRLRNE